jgi:pimeloyl-ACP methyl ester carboxylesterase
MTRLLFLPGVGADRRLFDAQRSCAADVSVIEWVAPATRDEPLTDYAARLAATIDTSRPFVIGGASFGGMVALELARHVRPLAVILIASCRSPSLLPRHSRQLSAFAQLLPAATFTSAAARSRFVTSRFGVRTREERQLFGDMLRATPPAFVQWACRTIFGWPGAADLNVPVHHIHGAHDRVIPLRCVQPDVVVPAAGHLLNVTYRGDLNAFIDAAIATRAAR